jgi:hypothetical protein
MSWCRLLLCSIAAGCLLASGTGCAGSYNPYYHESGQNPYGRRGTIHQDAYPPGYRPGHNPRGPDRGRVIYGRRRR